MQIQNTLEINVVYNTNNDNTVDPT